MCQDDEQKQSGQIIVTSAEATLNCGLGRESTQNAQNIRGWVD